MIDTGRSCSDSNINTLDNGSQLVVSSSSSSSSDFMSSFKAADTNGEFFFCPYRVHWKNPERNGVLIVYPLLIGYPHKPESATPGSSTSESLSALMELQLEGTDSTNIVQSLPQISPTQNLMQNLSSADTGYTSAEQFVGMFSSGSQTTPQWTPEPGTQGNTLSSGYVQAPVTITSTQASITTTQTDDLISFATTNSNTKWFGIISSTILYYVHQLPLWCFNLTQCMLPTCRALYLFICNMYTFASPV